MKQYSKRGAHVIELAYRLILGTHVTSAILINNCHQKIGEKTVNETVAQTHYAVRADLKVMPPIS